MQKAASVGVELAEREDLSKGIGPDASEILRIKGLRKVFRTGEQEIAPLDGIDLSVARGEMIAVIGPSGTGKSTFLHLLAALDTPTSGEVYFAGDSLKSLGEAELAEYRNHSVGFVWQRHHLLPDFTAAENVAMPLLVRGEAPGEALRAAKRLAGAKSGLRITRTNSWRAFRWRTAACGDCAGAGKSSLLTSCGRTDRRSG